MKLEILNNGICESLKLFFFFSREYNNEAKNIYMRVSGFRLKRTRYGRICRGRLDWYFHPISTLCVITAERVKGPNWSGGEFVRGRVC